MIRTRGDRRWRRPLAALLAATALLALASPASGADRVYWSNIGLSGGAQTISFANQDGSGGGGDLNTAGATLNFPAGVAIDSATERVYWANSGFGGGPQGISFANLDGSGAGGDLNTAGATLNAPVGIALDLSAGRVYWVNNGSGTPPFAISYANLDGSGGGGDLNTAGATLDTPTGSTVFPAAGRIYWTNNGGSAISFAALDGSGGGDLNTAGATLNGPQGPVLDPAAGRIYWTNAGGGISFAATDGSGSGGDLNTAGATVNSPVGGAIDSAAGRIYWGNGAFGGGPQRISFAALDGSGGSDLSTAGATVDTPIFPALLKTPLGSGAPKLRGAHGHRSKISCTQDSWAADQVASRLFRAPSTFTYSWSRNGKPIASDNTSSYKAHAVGNYRCTVAAQNQAGETLQTSAPHAAFRLAKLYRNKRRGAAKLIVKLPSRGKVTLSGKKLKNRSRRPHLASKQRHLFKAALPIKAKGQAKRNLKRTGHTKLKLKVRFEPKGAKGGTLTRSVTLRFRPPPERVIPAVADFPLGLGG